MKAIFYDPYLDSLGGGERYILTLVEALLQRQWQVGLLWDGEPVHEQVKRKFGLQIETVEYVPTYYFTSSLMRRISFLRQFDLSFVISDGTIPVLSATKNIVHFQVPFHGIYGGSLINQIKKHTIHHYVANSHFTKDVVDEEYGINCGVIYPPVATNEFKPGKKQNVILYLARFSNLLQSKGHMTAIEAFKQLYDSGIHSYRLWLVGSTEVGADEYVNMLRDAAKGYPIEITTDLTFDEVISLYKRAKFFWGVAGYDVDEQREPEKCEHFGISLVEAMASGAVPLAIRKGGYREIIRHLESGYLWTSLDQLVAHTSYLINHPKELQRMKQAAEKRADAFSIERFVQEYMQLIED